MAITKEQFSNIVKAMKCVYPYETFIKDKDAFNTWFALLEDLEYEAVVMATKKYMQTNTKVPTPADIRLIATETKEQWLSEGEVVSIVRKAIANGAYGAEEEFCKLPPIIQKAVGSPDRIRGWATTENLNHEVVDSEIVNSYRRELRNTKIENSMSPDVRDRLNSLLEGNHERQAILTNER